MDGPSAPTSADDGQARLIDGDGGAYTGLADFRAGNDVPAHDDTVLTLRNITSVPGEGEFVVVSGHTAPVWPWWVAGGSAVLLVAVPVGFVVRRRRAARDPLLSRCATSAASTTASTVADIAVRAFTTDITKSFSPGSSESWPEKRATRDGL